MLGSTARNLALNFLARREYSEFALKNKLLERGCDQEEVVTVLALLVKEGLLSDRRFAENYIHSRARRGFGPMYIMAGLREQGVDEELIKSSLKELETSWAEMAAQVRKKKFGAEIPKDYELRIKQMNFLKYRGFASREIKGALGGN